VPVGKLKLGGSLGGSDRNNVVAINKEDTRILSSLIGFVKFNQCHICLSPFTQGAVTDRKFFSCLLGFDA